MDILKTIDIFGARSEWRTAGELRYRTNIGGIVSIICCSCLILFMIFFGGDFYYRTNPKIMETQIFNQEFISTNLTSSQGIIAWKIEDHYTNTPNFTGIIFPRINYQSFKVNPITQNLDLLESRDLPIKKCSEVKDIDPILKATQNLDNWNCMDFTGVDFQLGGYWGAPYVNMIYMLMDSCNSDKTKCSNIEEIRSLAPGNDNSLFFSMLYPDHYFSPLNYTSPLNYAYFYDYKTIDFNIIKKNVIFFKDVSSEDDNGWIFSNIKKSGIFAFDYALADSFFKSENDYQNVMPDSNTVIYMNRLYFSKNSYLYKRSFMKFQDLVAIVGGLLKAIVFAFSLFFEYYNSIILDKKLINTFFEIKNVGEIKINRATKPIGSKLGIQKSSNNLIINNNSMFKLNANPKINVAEIVQEPGLDSRKLFQINPNNYALKINSNSSNNVGNFITSSILKARLCHSKKNDPAFVAYQLVSKRTDLEVYIRNTILLEKLLVFTFSEEQRNCFAYMNLIDLSEEAKIEKSNKIIDRNINNISEKDFNEAIKYFETKIENRNLNVIDEKLLENSDFEIKIKN